MESGIKLPYNRLLQPHHTRLALARYGFATHPVLSAAGLTWQSRVAKRVSMTARFHPALLGLAVSLLITGCATHTPQPSLAPAPVAPTVAAQTEEPTAYGQFQPDTLYALLTAEIAGQRNRFDIALRNYLEQAVRTRDAGIIERAMEISEFLGAHQQAMDMALLWTEVEPDNPEALRAAALQLARAGQHDDAMNMMEKVLLLQDDTHF